MHPLADSDFDIALPIVGPIFKLFSKCKKYKPKCCQKRYDPIVIEAPKNTEDLPSQKVPLLKNLSKNSKTSSTNSILSGDSDGENEKAETKKTTFMAHDKAD